MKGARRGPWMRAAIGAVAIVAALWFACGARQARDLDRATAIVDSGARLSATQAERADSLLNAAGQLKPDTQVALVRSQVALASGHRDAAERLARAVTRQEPRNPQAWLALTRASITPTEGAIALQRLAALVPYVPSKP